MLLGILGEAGTGKDEVARILVQEGRSYVIALADPMKVYCQWMFGWPPDMLWGTSAKRAELDTRFKFPKCPECGRTEGIRNPDGLGPEATWRVCAFCRATAPLEQLMVPLSPRYTLQHLGDWARRFRPDAYIALALRRTQAVLANGRITDDPLHDVLDDAGVIWGRWQEGNDLCTRVVINDVRMKNEIAGIREAGGRVYRVKRRHAIATTAPGIPNHQSEMEQRSVADQDVDGVIDNNGTLEDLRLAVHDLLDGLEH
jgi:hypothetical protein